MSPDVRFTTWRNVLVADWRLDTNVAGIKAMHSQIATLHKAQQKPIAIVHIVGARSKPPSSEARELMADVFRKEGAKEHLAMNVTIIQGSGFRAASVRAVASGVALLGRMKFPHEVHPTIESGVERVVSLFGFDLTAKKRLVGVVRDFCDEKGPPDFD